MLAPELLLTRFPWWVALGNVVKCAFRLHDILTDGVAMGSDDCIPALPELHVEKERAATGTVAHNLKPRTVEKHASCAPEVIRGEVD